MAENKHTINELYQMQSLPLDDKVRMTEKRIREWVENYGIENVYVSFSGGKDSNVLLDIVRGLYPEIKAVFVDTGLEYPDIRDWVKTFDNVVWIKPEYTFKQIILKYGYPFISKEVSEYVYYAKQYIIETNCLDAVCRLCGVGDYRGQPPCGINDLTDFDLENAHWSIKALGGVLGRSMEVVPRDTPSKERSRFNCEKYSFFLEDGAPPIGNQCCEIMKKDPIHIYERLNGVKGITAQMATEGHLRVQHWLKNGCNGFDMGHPISHPMAFWTEQDVLLYIYSRHLPICPLYGEVVEDYEAEGQTDGQMSLSDYGVEDTPHVLKTSGCARTGCIFCGYGLHLNKSPNRLEKLSVSHPNLYDYVMRGGAFDEDGIWRPDNRGLGYWYCIEWINKHGGFHITYVNREHYINNYSTEETKKYL